MKEFWLRFVKVVVFPESFFEQVREEHSWKMPFFHLLVLALLLGSLSTAAWGLNIPGDTPINSSLTAQQDVYPYWRDTLLPQFGGWSYPLAAGLVAFEVIIISLIYTPLVFLVFRYLGGVKDPAGTALLHAFQGFVYGLTPVLFGGFLPWLGLATGFYAAVLQLYRGPAITMRNRTVFAYLLLVVVMTYAISRYWQGGLI
jgi:hypothetical protein